ncbi:MAG: AAA family ATPase [Deltaproteobacteria bacterium]|nr:AAA family ATPase [Deltaproteobacteria bacterium]
MMFTHLTIENWKNFRKVDVELGPRVFLVGANATGKSNLLDVLRFLRDIADPKGGLQRAVEDRGGFSPLRSLFARKNPAVLIEVTARIASQSWAYRLCIDQRSRDVVAVREESVTRDGVAMGCARPDADDRRDPARLTQTSLEQVNLNQRFRQLAEFLAGIRYLHAVPQIVRDPERGGRRKRDPFGADLFERMLDAPVKRRTATLRAISKALKVAVPQLKDLKLDKDRLGVPHLYGLYEHWRPKAGWQTEEAFSDGTLRLLALLWALSEGRGPLLLEEPELSLNAAIIRQLPRIMGRMSNRTGRQVLVTTHSADLLNDPGIPGEAILLLSPAKEGTIVEPAASRADIRQLLAAGVPPGEALLPHVEPQRAEQLSLGEW